MKLTTEYDVNDAVWYAYDEAREEGRAIGQGSTPDAACSDYWYQVRGDAAEISECPETLWWIVRQGQRTRYFLTRRIALEYVDKHDWQIV